MNKLFILFSVASGVVHLDAYYAGGPHDKIVHNHFDQTNVKLDGVWACVRGALNDGVDVTVTVLP